MTPGYYVRSGEVEPTGNELSGPNFQFLGTFTANALTDIITTSVPHGQIAAEVVILTSTGTLPSPLQPMTLYRVLTDGLTATTMKLGSNIGWNPPPENPPIDLLDSGTGTHSLWIRPLDYVGPFVTIPGSPSYITTEYSGGSTRGPLYWGSPPRSSNDGVRFQVKGSPLPSPLAQGIDYFSLGYVRSTGVGLGTGASKWQISGIASLSNGGGDIWSYADGTAIATTNGALGSVTSEAYYLISGGVEIVTSGSGGQGSGGGQLPVQERVRTILRSPDALLDLIHRAKTTINLFDNFKVIGPGFSGIGDKIWYNPEIGDDD